MTGSRTPRQIAAQGLSAELKELEDLRGKISTQLLHPDASRAITAKQITFQAEIKEADDIIKEFNVTNPTGQPGFSTVNIPTVTGNLQNQRKFYTSIVNRSRVVSEIAAVDLKTPKALSALNTIALTGEGETKPGHIRQAIVTSKSLLGSKDLLGIKLGDETSRTFITDNDCKAICKAAAAQLVTLEHGIAERAQRAITNATKNTDLATLSALAELTTALEIRNFIAEHKQFFNLDAIDEDTLKSHLVISDASALALQKAAKRQAEKISPKPKTTSAEASSTPPPETKESESPRKQILERIGSQLTDLEQARNAYATLVDPKFDKTAAENKETKSALDYMTNHYALTSAVLDAEQKNIEKIYTELTESRTSYISKSNSIYIAGEIDKITDPKDATLNTLATTSSRETFNKTITSLKSGNLKFDESTKLVILRDSEAIEVRDKAKAKLKALQPAAEAPVGPGTTPTPSSLSSSSSSPKTETISTAKPATAATEAKKPSETKTAAPPKDINSAIQKALPTIAREISLSDAKEVKAIVTLATDDGKDLAITREKIVPLKNKIDVLKSLDDSETKTLESKESKKIISDANTTKIRDEVRAQLERLIQAELKTAISTWGTDKVGDLLQLLKNVDSGKTDAASVVRTFVDAHKKDLGELNNFPDNALKNPLVFSDTKPFYELAKARLDTLVPQAFKETEDTITKLKLAEAKQATALAELATVDETNANEITGTLFDHKDQLGAFLNRVEDINDIKIFKETGVKTLQEKARDTIQAQIKQTVTDKIQTLKLPDDEKLLNMLAEAKNASGIRQTLVDYKTKLGLDHLDDAFHIQDERIIPPAMAREFQKHAATQRIPKTAEEKIIAEAIAKLQLTLTATNPISPAYKNLKDALLADSRAKTVFLAAAKRISGADDDKRAQDIADMLRPFLAPTKTEAEINRDLADLFAPNAAGASAAAAIAKVIGAANKAEADAREVKQYHTSLAETDKTITGMVIEANQLYKKTKAVADGLPDTDPKKGDKEKEAKAAMTACDNLIKQQKTISDALADVKKELDSIIAPAAGVGAAAVSPADALVKAKAAFELHKDAETTAKAELEKAKAAYTATQSKATEPGLLEISDAVTRAARGQDANSNAIWELNSCKRLKELYTGLYFLKHAAENYGNANAFDRLDSAITSIPMLITRIDELKKSKHTGAGAPMSAETQKQLDIMKAEFQNLHAEMMRIKDGRKTLSRDSAERMIQIFGSRNQQFTLEETKMIQKDSTGFAAWSSAIKGYAITNYARPALHVRSGDPYSPQLVQQKAYTTDTWRVYPPDPANVKSSDMIYFEHEYKQAGASESDFELTVVDLPQAISDKGLFMKFLMEKNKTSPADLAPGTPIHNLVFKNEPPALAPDAPPVIDEKTALKLLAYIPTGMSRDTTLAKEFMKYLHEHQNELLPLHDQYQTLTGAATQITRQAYLEKSEAERKNYAPYGASNLVSMPKADFFEQAAKILSVLVARGYSPMSITDAESQPLLLAIDCLAQKYGIRNMLNFPNSYQQTATPQQVEIARVMNYKIPALDVVDRTLAAAATAATAGPDSAATYISRPR